MQGYIYKITNLINDRIYIGQTIQDVKERFYQHCATKTSSAVLNMPIHKAILKYGKTNFSLEILEIVEQSHLDVREQYWIDYYDSYNNGYNATKGGQHSGKPFKALPIDVIISEYSKGKSLRTLGKEFGVDKQTIKSLLIREGVKLRITRTYKLSENDRKTLMSEYASGVSRKDIISKWGISRSYLSQLISGSRRI